MVDRIGEIELWMTGELLLFIIMNYGGWEVFLIVLGVLSVLASQCLFALMDFEFFTISQIPHEEFQQLNELSIFKQA